jgi:CheY-like chemotaxis protein
MYLVSEKDGEPALGQFPRSLRQHGVLIVDDDEGTRAVLDIWLRRHGCGVWLAAAGPEAIHLYLQHWHEIDAVLMDVNMAAMDGPQTLVALRLINPQVCCCFMSATLTGYTEADLLAFGAREIVRKPFRLVDIGQLLGKVGVPIPSPTSSQFDLWRNNCGER